MRILYQFGLLDDELVYFEIMKDLLKNIEGSNSIIIDMQEKIIELDGSYGISGNIYGEDINLMLPLRFYVDENASEMAIDLDPYVDFSHDLIDVYAYSILAMTPELEEELAIFADDQDVEDWFKTEAKSVISPILESTIQGTKYIDTLDEMETLFKENENDEYLGKFMFDHALDYIKDNDNGELIKEEEDWITISLDEHMLFHAFLHSLKEVADNEEAKKAFEEGSEETVESVIEELEGELENLDEYLIDLQARFQLEKGRIIASEAEVSLSFEEEGTSFTLTVTGNSTYKYGGETEYVFYGKERTALTDHDLETMLFEIEWEFDERMAELVAELEEEMYYEDEYYEYYEYELTDEELELIALIEAKEVTHEDFGLTEEEMYFWVFELELEGLVEEGTAELYYYE